MTKVTKLLATASVIAVSALGTAPAFAAGTVAGTDIVNTVSVNYQVGGTAQTAINASNTFKVDRRISLTVTEPGNATTSVAPGSAGQITTFLVTNTSNAPLDLGLTATQPSGGTAAHGGTDNFDVTGVTLYVDNASTGTVGSWDSGDAVVTFLDEVAPDASRTVFALASVPINRVNGDVAGLTLTAQAREAGAAGTQGIVSAQSTGVNDNTTVETVFADTAGATDAARDGQFSARDDYTVSAATLTVNKLSKIVSDPLNGTTNPKMIPGAVVEYCITVANAASSATATSVAISDPLPTQTTYVASSVALNGTVTAGVCNADGGAGGTYNSGTTTVAGTIPSVAAGQTRTLYFQVTIN